MPHEMPKLFRNQKKKAPKPWQKTKRGKHKRSTKILTEQETKEYAWTLENAQVHPSTTYPRPTKDSRFTTSVDGHTFLAQCHLTWTGGLGSICRYHSRLELGTPKRLAQWLVISHRTGVLISLKWWNLRSFPERPGPKCIPTKWWTLDPTSFAADGVNMQDQYSKTPKRARKTCFMLLT